VLISPIFHEQIFCTKVFCAAFMYLQFGFVIFWRKDFGAKAADKMLVKLTSGCFFKLYYRILLLSQSSFVKFDKPSHYLKSGLLASISSLL
jgi:hypothetical protein